MRFIMIHKADDNTEGRNGPPPPALLQALGGLIAESMAKGQLVSSGGLLPSGTATRLRAGHGKVSRIDGPFAESKELIGGFAVIDVPSREDAVEMGRRWMQAHADVLGENYEGEAEIRQLMTSTTAARRFDLSPAFRRRRSSPRLRRPGNRLEPPA